MEILSLLLPFVYITLAQSQPSFNIIRRIHVVPSHLRPVPFLPAHRWYRRLARRRFCSRNPWLPRCQRFFRRRLQNRFPDIQWIPLDTSFQRQQNIIPNRIPTILPNTLPNRIPERVPDIFPNTIQDRFEPTSVPNRIPNEFLPPRGGPVQPVCNIRCPPGLQLDAGQCRNLGADSLCPSPCPDGYKCHHGHCDRAPCTPACSGGLRCRDGKCLDVAVCEPACCTGQVCQRGVCVEEHLAVKEPACEQPCPAGYVCHNGHCDKVPDHCPEACPKGYICHDGHCDKDPHLIAHERNPDQSHAHGPHGHVHEPHGHANEPHGHANEPHGHASPHRPEPPHRGETTHSHSVAEIPHAHTQTTNIGFPNRDRFPPQSGNGQTSFDFSSIFSDPQLTFEDPVSGRHVIPR